MVNSEELISNTEYLTLGMRHRINRCCYNQVRQYFYIILMPFTVCCLNLDIKPYKYEIPFTQLLY